MFTIMTATRHATRVGVTALAFTALGSALSLATIGPRTIIGDFYQQFSDTHGPTFTAGSCLEVSTCFVTFQAAHQTRGAVIQTLSCTVQFVPMLGQTSELLKINLFSRKTDNSVPLRITELMPVKGVISGSSTLYFVHAAVQHLVPVGERAVVQFIRTGGTGANFEPVSCTISGQLV